MNKGVVIAIIMIALILAGGIVEVVVLDNQYSRLNEKIVSMTVKVQNQSLTPEEFYDFMDDWLEVRENSELLLPHLDVYEINLRVSETKSAIEQKDYKYAYMQLVVLEELTRYVPHLMKPILRHIL